MSKEEKETSAIDLIIETNGLIKEVLKTVELININYKILINDVRKSNLISKVPETKTGGGTVVTDIEPPLLASNARAASVPAMKKQISKNEIVKKYPVQQRILYADGKSKVAQANFVLSDVATGGKTLTIKGKTNLMGMWRANLSPGIYSIEIEKYGTENKAPINLAYQIEVSNDGPTELPDQKVTIE